MSIESELTALREAVDRLTAAVMGHAETRLGIFNRASAEALDAFPLDVAEIAAALNAGTEATETEARIEASVYTEAANESADEPAPVEVSLQEVRTLAKEMLANGQRDRLQTLLVEKLNVGAIDRLDADQRRQFVRLAHELAEAA